MCLLNDTLLENVSYAVVYYLHTLICIRLALACSNKTLRHPKLSIFFFFFQILMLNNDTTNDSVMQEERQGKMLMHTEFSLLSLLKDEPGVIQQHGMFSVSGSQLSLFDFFVFFLFFHFVCSFCRIWLLKRYRPIVIATTIFIQET